MRSADAWQLDLMQLVSCEGALVPVGDLIARIQADALEAAAKCCEQDASLYLASKGYNAACMEHAMRLREVARALSPTPDRLDQGGAKATT